MKISSSGTGSIKNLQTFAELKIQGERKEMKRKEKEKREKNLSSTNNSEEKQYYDIKSSLQDSMLYAVQNISSAT